MEIVELDKTGSNALTDSLPCSSISKASTESSYEEEEWYEGLYEGLL